jgi:DNA-binding CsgD family transcriptional regulator
MLHTWSWLLHSTSEKKSTLEGFFETAREWKWAVLCFGAYWTWMMSVLKEPTVILDTSSGDYVQGIAYAVWFCPLLVMTLTSVFVALWFKKTRTVFRSKSYQYSIMALMTLGGMFHVFWAFGLSSDDPIGGISVFVIQSILVGISAALFRIEIDRILGHVGANRALSIAFLGILLAMVLVIALTFLPSFAWALVQLVFPLVLFVSFRKSIGGIEGPRYYGHGLENRLFIPSKFLSTSFFQGVAFGVMSGSMILLSSSESGWVVGTVSRLLALLLVGVVTVFFKLDYNQLLYKTGFPLMALGFVCLMLLPAVPQVGGVLAWAGYLFLDIILWSLGAHLIKNAGLPATWIASFPGAALTAGTLLGGLIGIYVAQQGGGGDPVFGGLMAVFLLTVALVMTSGRNIRYGWGTSRPSGEGGRDDGPRAVVRFLSAEYSLTRRESDILFFMVQGKRKKDTGAILCISLDTVKTHAKNIYRKLLIHSQEELQELVDATAARLEVDVE